VSRIDVGDVACAGAGARLNVRERGLDDRLINHALDLLSRQATLVVGDHDVIRLASSLVGCRDIQNTVGINVESDEHHVGQEECQTVTLQER